MKKDTLFNIDPDGIKPFVFDKQVSDVFDDMLDRSIPFYQQLTEAIGQLIKHFNLPPGKIYDLGSSTGTLLCYLSKIIPSRVEDMIGIDSSPHMVQKAREKSHHFKTAQKVKFIEDDIETYPFGNVSVFILNFTLQFVAPERREHILKTLYKALNPGGMIIISEKIISPSEVINNKFIDIYYQFKTAQGYSNLEISNKRDALENVLIPDSMDTHLSRLKKTGFKNCISFFQWFNFAAFMGIKDG